MNKEDVVHIYSGILLNHKKNEIMPFAAIWMQLKVITVFIGDSNGKEPACNARDPGLIPRSGRSPGEGNGKPPQYSCLENPMDVGAWWATVYTVALSDLATNTHTKMIILSEVSPKEKDKYHMISLICRI